MDLMDCQDLPQLQAIICMVLFLQTSAKLSTCYVYIGTCLHSAVKMGLHRSVAKKFNPIEAEIRKRVFWQIWKMNVFVGVMLGMPMMLDEEDIDQELPLDIDDEHILVDKILPMPKDKIPIMAASNAHTKLTKILQKIVKYIYPIKGVIQDASTTKSFSVSHAKVREIERDLQQWMENLPMKLRPGGESSPELTRYKVDSSRNFRPEY